MYMYIYIYIYKYMYIYFRLALPAQQYNRRLRKKIIRPNMAKKKKILGTPA